MARIGQESIDKEKALDDEYNQKGEEDGGNVSSMSSPALHAAATFGAGISGG
jgi:hypothetical protein